MATLERLAFALLDTGAGLDEYQERLAAAHVCGLDCEWPPGGTPRATLVSLALWSPQHGFTALLIDMHAVGAEARPLLKQLLRNAECLKLGFNVATDVRALELTVAEPCVDLASLHARLVQAGAPGVAAPRGSGLSQLCEAQLGLSLDKEHQASAWGERPLSQEQLQYAAADSACLLLILADYLSHLIPADYPYANGSSSSNGGGGSSRAASTLPASDWPLSADLAGGDDASPAAEPSVQRLEDAAAVSFSFEALRLAAEHWGRRLDVTQLAAARRPAARRGGKHAQQQPVALPGGGFPLHVPWLAQGSTGRPAFVCDVMAQGLARQLRLLGFDAEDVAVVPKDQRHAVHRLLVERAEAEGRVILTCDRMFVSRNLSDSAYLVRGKDKHAQAAEVVRAFELQVEQGDLLSRCARCNGEFIPTPLTAAQLPPGHGVPQNVLDRHGREDLPGFWVCSACSSVYWQGSQYTRAMERLSGLVTTAQL